MSRANTRRFNLLASRETHLAHTVDEVTTHDVDTAVDTAVDPAVDGAVAVADPIPYGSYSPPLTPCIIHDCSDTESEQIEEDNNESADSVSDSYSCSDDDNSDSDSDSDHDSSGCSSDEDETLGGATQLLRFKKNDFRPTDSLREGILQHLEEAILCLENLFHQQGLRVILFTDRVAEHLALEGPGNLPAHSVEATRELDRKLSAYLCFVGVQPKDATLIWLPVTSEQDYRAGRGKLVCLYDFVRRKELIVPFLKPSSFSGLNEREMDRDAFGQLASLKIRLNPVAYAGLQRTSIVSWETATSLLCRLLVFIIGFELARCWTDCDSSPSLVLTESVCKRLVATFPVNYYTFLRRNIDVKSLIDPGWRSVTRPNFCVKPLHCKRIHNRECFGRRRRICLPADHPRVKPLLARASSDEY